MKKIIIILLITIIVSGCNKETTNDNQNIDTDNTTQNIMNKNNSEEINKPIQYPEKTYQNWKTYINQGYKFSISLPDGWQQIIDEHGSIPGDIVFQDNSFQLINSDDENKLTFFVNAWSDLCKNQDTISCYEKNSHRNIKFIRKENIITNNFEGIFLEYKIQSNISPESFPPYIYLFPSNDNNSLMIFSFSKNDELTKQIMSTFKYVD